MEISEPTITRRRTLLSLFVLASSALIYKILGMFFAFAQVPQKKNAFGGIIEAGPLSEIPAMNTPPVHHPEGRFWLVYDQKGLRAIHSSCTHLDCLFTWDDERQTFICPCHGSEFDTEGTVLKGPATRSLDRFCLEITNSSGETVRDNLTQNGAALAIEDLLTSPDQEEETTEAKQTPQAQFYLKVDTSKKVTSEQSPA